MGSGQENQVIALWRDLGMTQQKPTALAGLPANSAPDSHAVINDAPIGSGNFGAIAQGGCTLTLPVNADQSGTRREHFWVRRGASAKRRSFGEVGLVIRYTIMATESLFRHPRQSGSRLEGIHSGGKTWGLWTRSKPQPDYRDGHWTLAEAGRITYDTSAQHQRPGGGGGYST
jgi:hypothetical protein